jgi:hypothetical protein
LVDALHEGEIDETELAKIEDSKLPDAMKGLPSLEKLMYVREQVTTSPSMSDALTNAVKRHAE